MKINYNIKDFLSSLIFYLAILVFIIGFNFTDSPPPFGWYQQFMPNLGGRSITDVFFLDSLTGYAVTNNLSPSDTGYILKTTNGGDNWDFNLIINRNFFKIKFIDINTGYAGGGSGGGTAYLYRTTNAGVNWNVITTPDATAWRDMSILNQDTMWLVDNDGLVGGVFLTTNGGVSWVTQYSQLGNNPSHIYMFNARIGFMDAGGLRKTMDGGTTWSPIPGGDYFTHMYFTDSLLGWKSNGFMKKTTDGGYNWVLQSLPQTNYTAMADFSNAILDTMWGVGGRVVFPNNQGRGIIYKTTNGGANWGFQLPDTSINIFQYGYNNFINKLNGWAYSGYTGVHTVTGGDTVWYMGIIQKSKEIPKNFILKQNYPNPFNPRTVIPYSLKSPAYVRLIAYDIIGREVQRLVDQKQIAGEYEVDFMGKFSATGIYFYRVQVTDEKGNQSFSDTKKMILLK